MPRNLCKFGSPQPAQRSRRALQAARLTVVFALLASGCVALRGGHVAESQLDAAQPVAFESIETIPISDLSAIGSECTALGERLALFEVTDADRFDALRRAAPTLRSRPDLNRGMLVGVVSWLGAPVGASGGVELVSLREVDGVGLVALRYRPGTYLPDGGATVSVGYVPARAHVLVVTVGAARYYVETDER